MTLRSCDRPQVARSRGGAEELDGGVRGARAREAGEDRAKGDVYDVRWRCKSPIYGSIAMSLVATIAHVRAAAVLSTWVHVQFSFIAGPQI